jgi:phage shock protein C
VNQRRLYRSTDDRIFAGVAGGLANYLDVDPVIVRIIWFLSVFVTGTLTFWAYVIMMIAVPLEPTEWPPQSPWAPGGGPAGYGATYAPPAAGPIPSGEPGAAPGGEPGTAPMSEPAASTGWTPGAAPAAAPGTPGAAPGAAPAPGAPGAPPAPGGWWSSDPRWQWRQDRWQARQDRWQARQDRWQQRWQNRAERNEYHAFGGPGIVFGLLLVIIGGLLAAHQFDPTFDLNLTWPVAIIAFGALLIVSSLRFRDRS